MGYEVRIIRRLLEIGVSNKHNLHASVLSDGHISIYVHNNLDNQAVVDSFYTDEHEDERDAFVWLNEWAETIRKERDCETH